MRLPGGCIDDFDHTRSTIFDCDVGLFNPEFMCPSVTELGLDPAVGGESDMNTNIFNRNGTKLTQDRLEKRSTKGLLRRLLWYTNAGLLW